MIEQRILDAEAHRIRHLGELDDRRQVVLARGEEKQQVSVCQAALGQVTLGPGINFRDRIGGAGLAQLADVLARAHARRHQQLAPNFAGARLVDLPRHALGRAAGRLAIAADNDEQDQADDGQCNPGQGVLTGSGIFLL